MDVTAENRIWEELKAIREELEYIKAHMVDADTILTPDEEALKEFDTGKVTRLDEFKRELEE